MLSDVLSPLVIDQVEAIPHIEPKERAGIYVLLVQRAWDVSTEGHVDENMKNVLAYGMTPKDIESINRARERGMPSLGEIIDYLRGIGRDPLRGEQRRTAR